MCHGRDVQRRQIAHVDKVVEQAGAAGQGAVEQTLDDADARGDVCAQDGAEDAHSGDDGELGLVAVLLDKVPGRLLGEQLTPVEGGQVLVHGPVLLGEGVLLAVAVGNGGKRRGQNDPLNTGGLCGLENPQGAVAGGDDDLVVALGVIAGERRRKVVHVLAAADGLGPSLVLGQVCGEEGELVQGHGRVGGLERLAHSSGLICAAESRADRVAG